MTSPLEIAVRRVHLGLLWGASLLVPVSERREWSHEWRTEMWYVLKECSLETSVDPKSVKAATAFCLGAYQDAIWLRKRWWQERRPLAQAWGSAPVCLALLTGIFFATWGIAHISPRVAVGMSRVQVYPWRISNRPTAPCDCAFDFVSAGRLPGTTQLFFDGFSHYRVAQDAVWAESVPRSEWLVAHTKPEFFAVLHLPVHALKSARQDSDALPQIVLSHETWLRVFGGRTNIAGTTLQVGSVDAVVAGVAFGSSLGLPGNAQAWLLGSDPPNGTGIAQFVVAHLSPGGYFDDGRWTLSVLGILLACLLMPFVTHLAMGDYGCGSHKPTLVRRSLFWGFHIAKISVILAIVYFSSIDLACLFVQPFSQFSGNIQAASAFTLCLFGVRWAFLDQQQRCPICLRRMAHPVEVGQPSRIFLDWNGTELVCERGHTLLHIPEFPTSWFGAQRWVCLDGTWEFLFARPSGTSSFV